MKFVRKDLLECLTKLKPAMGSSSVAVDALKHIWFDKDSACTYNGGLGIRIPLESGLTGGVPGAPLLGLLGDDSVKEITLELKGNMLEAKLGRATAKLVTMDLSKSPWNFPLKVPKDAVQIGITEKLLEALKRVSIIRASPATQTHHHGIVTYPDSEVFSLYCTDSKAVAEVLLDMGGDLENLKEFILPHALVDVMISICKPGDKLAISKSCLQVSCANGILACSNALDSSNLIDIPKAVDDFVGKSPKFTPLPAGLSVALDRVQVLTGAGEEAFLSMEADGTDLKLYGKLRFGEFNETLKLEKITEPAKIVVDANILRLGLNEAKRFQITKRALLMKGEGAFLFIVAAHT